MLNNPLFLILLLTGVVFLIAGFILLKYPPKKINSLYGYRTANSMKNIDRWNFSQIYSAKEMMKIGGVLVVFSVLAFSLEIESTLATVLGICLLVLAAGFLFVRVENEIKRRFMND